MKLHTKLTLFTTLSTVLIVVLFILLLPGIMQKVAMGNTNRSLFKQKEKVLQEIHANGIDYYLQGDSAYGSYSMLKEEYISLEPVTSNMLPDTVTTSQRVIDDDTITYRILTYTFPVAGKKYLLEIGRQIATINADSSALQSGALYVLIPLVIITLITNLVYTRHILSPLGKIIKQRLINRKFPFKETGQPVKTSTADFKYLDQSITSLMAQIKLAFEKEREFTSNASHELTTPVSIMQSKIENMMGEPDVSAGQQSRLLGLMQTLKRLKKIVQSLLLISRIENEQYSSRDTIHPSVLINEVIDELSHRIEDKKLSVQIRIRPEVQLQHLNRELIFQMFYNLINNAIRYNKPMGSITIQDAWLPNGVYTICIADTGVGIGKEKINEIFDRFKKSPGNGSEGYGLGLSIVKSIVLHQGLKIDVSSEKGIGSGFTVTFKQ